MQCIYPITQTVFKTHGPNHSLLISLISPHSHNVSVSRNCLFLSCFLISGKSLRLQSVISGLRCCTVLMPFFSCRVLEIKHVWHMYACIMMKKNVCCYCCFYLKFETLREKYVHSMVLQQWNVTALHVGTRCVIGWKNLSSPSFQHFFLFWASENLLFSIDCFVVW